MDRNDKLSFHNIGKPVALSEIKDNPATRYIALYDMYTVDILNELSLPIQLDAFGEGSPLDYRVQQEAHVAFKVANIKEALANKEVIMPLYMPFSGYQCAMVLINSQPIELIETSLSEREIWGNGIFKDSLLYADE
ncbi:hypothetical protein GYN21_06985 [Lactococcus piscium]|uniref:RES domain-containing protein n=1 Tax=Pseudolactococcus carnosus TaxID=2749961 RepID=A0ABT0ATN9_9LACT|nr:hypothetical protein [Lactococcus carnosus]